MISDGKQAISTCMLLIDQGLFESECLHSCWIATLHHIILLVERDRNQIFTYRDIEIEIEMTQVKYVNIKHEEQMHHLYKR